MKLQSLVAVFLPFLAVAYASVDDQLPMTDAHHKPSYEPLTSSKPTLADLLTSESSASIFYSYARELELCAIFSDEGVNNTLLVPTNKAVMALHRKPHQGPETVSGDVTISEEEFDSISKRNVEKWISAHIIPESPITLESKTYPTLLHRKTVSFTALPKSDPKAAEWTRVLVNGDVHIIGMKEALNGVLYLIDGTVSVD
ncbi:hypothetical protein EYR38_003292 [Pleurotus pulmonarius]|nr:hypothetical protein EYR38_003292 [Pleurotus pulmonarius]